MLWGAGLLTVPLLFGANPAWWSDPATKIIDDQPGVSHATSDNYAPANQGQLKLVAKKAAIYLNNALPSPGAGLTVNNLVNGFQHTAQDYAPINLGQLKAVAKPFYDRLHEAGYDTHANLVTRGFASADPSTRGATARPLAITTQSPTSASSKWSLASSCRRKAWPRPISP